MYCTAPNDNKGNTNEIGSEFFVIIRRFYRDFQMIRNRVSLYLSACKVPFIIAEETKTQKLSDGKNPDLYWESIRNAGA